MTVAVPPDVLTTYRPVIVLVGPTAVGKSQIAIHVARALDTEVLTADSRQVYRGMDIGMDKPSPAERHGVPHRLIDLVDPDESFNAGAYRRLAVIEIERLHREGRSPLVVGGTGLYIRALLRGLWSGPGADPTLRARLEEQERQEGAGFLHRELAVVDPETAARLHPHDRVKIIRALEVYRLTNEPLSEVHRRHAFADRPFTPLLLGLNRERPALYGRIDARVDEQLAKGLVEETRRLLSQSFSRTLGSMKGLGYRQIAGFLEGEYDYAEAVRRLKRDTRHFAKRQMTWFRKEPGLHWLMVPENERPDQTAARVVGEVARFLGGLVTAERPVTVQSRPFPTVSELDGSAGMSSPAPL